MMRILQLVAATASVVLIAAANPAQPVSAPLAYSYADLVDRALTAPVALTATISGTIRLAPAQAPGLSAGRARLYVEATANSLIRGPAGGLPPQIRYLADVPLDAKGKVPKLKGQQVLLLARPVSGRPGELQLVAPDTQFMLDPEIERRVRAIVTEAVGRNAPPPITGITSAFHVAGAIPGEGETQIFLSTAGNRPISLNVLRRPGQEPIWSVALTEVVDEAAKPPVPETLQWYRLACGLPATLPDKAVAELEPADAEAARADYRYVMDRLGACTRDRPLRTS